MTLTGRDFTASTSGPVEIAACKISDNLVIRMGPEPHRQMLIVTQQVIEANALDSPARRAK